MQREVRRVLRRVKFGCHFFISISTSVLNDNNSLNNLSLDIYQVKYNVFQTIMRYGLTDCQIKE